MDAPWYKELTWKKPKTCADKLNLDFHTIMGCYNGTRGDTLEKKAIAAFTSQFPKPVYMPQVAVNGKVVSADYPHIKAAACAAGSSSSVC